MISRFAVAASLALALAACGSSNEPSSESTTTATTSTEAPEAAVTEAAPSEAPSTAAATPSPASAPTPNASASAAADESESTTGASASPPQAFNQCAACHSTEPGKTIIGPSLAGVYGTKAGQTPGFQFSSAMKNSGMVLDAADLDKFLADPKGTVPGTIMAFAGLKDASQRKAVIDYLKTLK
jgi:cytochrome c2